MKKILLLFIFTLFLWLSISSPCLGKQKKGKTRRGKITASSLNVRKGPFVKFKKLFSLSKGSKVTIYRAYLGWYYISYEGKKGWASQKYIQILPKKKSSKKTPKKGKFKNFQDLGLFKITYYWMIHEKNFKGPKNTPIYGKNGKLIGRFSKKFVRRLKIEGTGKLNNGKVVNALGKGRFFLVKAPYGVGVRNIPLIPFHSIAVDRKIIPIGSKLYIPQAKGVKLPNGTIHDGLFYAHDVGGGIRGNHIDVFTGLGDHRKIFVKAGIKNLRKIRIFIRIK